MTEVEKDASQEKPNKEPRSSSNNEERESQALRHDDTEIDNTRPDNAAPHIREQSEADDAQSNDTEIDNTRPDNSAPFASEQSETDDAQDHNDEEGRTIVSQQEGAVREESVDNGPVIRLISSIVFVLAATAAVMFSGIPSLLLLLAASALGLAIWLTWNSLQRMGESEKMGFDEALSLAAPTATEEQKRSVLRALKDLEYERHVGKISEEDFKTVSAEYRAQAKKWIALQDESMAERLDAAKNRVAQHLKNAESKGQSGQEKKS